MLLGELLDWGKGKVGESIFSTLMGNGVFTLKSYYGRDHMLVLFWVLGADFRWEWDCKANDALKDAESTSYPKKLGFIP